MNNDKNHVGAGLRWAEAIAKEQIPIAAESAPAAGAERIDSDKFHKLMMAMRAAHGPNPQQPYRAVIAHINAWGAKQREEGRQEGKSESDRMYGICMNTAGVDSLHKRIAELEREVAANREKIVATKENTHE